ncbi:phosphatase PAP2 family protein [Rhizobium laguerreae]|uniref:phosphatase PAP2 family protein n=1 Tax=Rhizobium laguerreae TaxID=1076926 RepID=UPI001C915AAD|nr:phosphatase PAP2 family protein [Rhizobium laguerreae]MBY3095630.1 phosphatase PAP2 family protein [Rhizobium laguerreae]MBY3102841.1 phosphatase PAP2 family protein [Rhizobium laguerreae]MBY3109203.1 phosphatase PAP2 family protein [Rhizobium laguerreae]MBY3129988.1 phosphatase PAP2 family protein [Rhizobium laguerreae]MBY3143788.1 phosphatase PAP2 family protein [Rhizobium laguerreae]
MYLPRYRPAANIAMRHGRRMYQIGRHEMHFDKMPANGKTRRSCWLRTGLDLKMVATVLGFLILAALTAVIADMTIATMVLPGWTRSAAGWISTLTDPLVILPLMIGAFIAGRIFRMLGFGGPFELTTSLLTRSISAVAAATLLKGIIGRARPNETSLDPFHFQPFAAQDIFASAPSAQATLAAAIGCSLAMSFPKARIPILAGVIAVCLSRVLVGEHWTSDVIFGLALGWGIAVVRNRRHASVLGKPAG